MNILFFGTPSFAAHILDALLSSEHHIVGVVTQPDRPRGRKQQVQPPAVKELLFERGEKIPLFQPEKASDPSVAKELKALHADLFVVAAYGEIIKENLLKMPKYGCINVHPSLLPKYRGAAPIQRTLMNGDEKSGVCIIEMVKKMDAGPILGQIEEAVPPDMSFGELSKKLCALSIPLLFEVIDGLEEGSIRPIYQNEKEVTFAGKIIPEDRFIHWESSAQKIHNQIRALAPTPGAVALVHVGKEKKRLIIRRAEIDDLETGNPKETLVWDKNRWIVRCGEKSLSILEVQLEGKKSVAITPFIQGMGDPPLLD